jgi:site-specific DNA recombinase
MEGLGDDDGSSKSPTGSIADMGNSRVRSKPVGIWLRVSTEDQAQSDAPEHHEKRARMYAEARGWKVVEVYHLEGVSGKSVKDHPETQRMLRDVKEHAIEALIFSKLARLARSTRELLDFSDHFEEHGADLVSLQEAIDTSTPAGRLFYTVIAAMAQWEREEIADRVRASVAVRAKLGKPLGGAAPYGYQWSAGELVPEPTEAPVRKLMYDLFLETRRKKTVARLLNEAGHRTRKGALFTDTTVDRLLRDPTAKGWRRANYTRSTGDGKAWEEKPEEEWTWLPVPAIVDEKLWEEANAILSAQRASRRKVSRQAKHLFSGLTVCGSCGQKMYARRKSPKYVCRGCRNKIGIEDLEAIFQSQLKAYLFSPEEIAAHLAGADERVKTTEALLETLLMERESVTREMDKVYRAYVNDEISVRVYGSQYRPLEERASQLENEIPRLQGDLDFLKIEYLSSDEILAEARDLNARWDTLTPEEKRKIVEQVVEKITVGNKEIQIELAYLPTSAPLERPESRPPQDPDPEDPSSPHSLPATALETVWKRQRGVKDSATAKVAQNGSDARRATTFFRDVVKSHVAGRTRAERSRWIVAATVNNSRCRVPGIVPHPTHTSRSIDPETPARARGRSSPARPRLRARGVFRAGPRGARPDPMAARCRGRRDGTRRPSG